MATGPKKPRDPSARVARRLLAEGRIGRDLHDAAMRRHDSTGVRFEEAVLQLGMTEEQLLRTLAEMYRVQYISTPKLAAAGVDKRVLALLPARIAEQREVVPVLLDRQKSVLSVVMADPDDAEALKEIELATQVRTIRPLLARPAAVRAAIGKFYRGEDFAFSVFEDDSYDVARAFDRDPIANLSAHRAGPMPVARPSRAPGSLEGPSRPPLTDDPSPLPATLSPALASKPPARSGATEPESLSAPAASREPVPREPERVLVIGDPFQFAVVMVSLLEGGRKDLRGHSLQTSRLVRKVCEKLGVDGPRVRDAEIAALLHDLGKSSSYHLTPYNVARFDGHRAAAEKHYATPGRVVESARIGDAALHAVTHMYERYDGRGFPDAQRAGDIPLGSRILAICDTYADLTSNPRNSFRRVLAAQEACDAIRELEGSVFDPKIVDRFVRVVLGDDIAERLRSDRGTVLLVDPDVEETTVIELALVEKHYDVHIAHTAEEAIRYLESANVDLVVSEMALPGGSGFELLEKVRAVQSGGAIPVVFFSEEADSTIVARALDAGAADYLFKPLANQVVAAKIRRLLEQSHDARGARGVSGSLEEMALPDLVQILHQGRKSGLLEIASDGENGRIFFKDGAIVDVSWRALRGEEAFYAVVGVERGRFRIDPGVAPQEETVQASPELLLLEGMRRLDEAKR